MDRTAVSGCDETDTDEYTGTEHITQHMGKECVRAACASWASNMIDENT